MIEGAPGSNGALVGTLERKPQGRPEGGGGSLSALCFGVKGFRLRRVLDVV